MSHIYDEHETIAGLRRVVADKGEEYVYELDSRPNHHACMYWDRERNCGSCLVGKVLELFGFEPPTYIEGKSLAGLLLPGSVSPRAEEFIAWFSARFTEKALRVLAVAQNEQDQCTPWGEALLEAEREYARLTGRGE